MILPIHQNPRDLALTIIPGKLQTPLTILKHHVLTLGMWQLSFHIIGESHLVTIEYDQQPILCEVLACADIMAAAAHHHTFRDLASHCYEQPGYSVRVDFEDQTDSLAPSGSDNLLEMVFPDIENKSPITQVLWEMAGENIMQWKTLHLYPYNGRVICVRSLSYFDTLHYNRTT
jgi:hypothetical protein